MQEVDEEKVKGANDGLMLVGVGASAGGVDALLRFFERVPPESGLAFAVLMHTSPDRESHLAEVIQTKTALPVVQATETVVVEPNKVYCLPPDKRVRLSDGRIRLEERGAENGHAAPIDQFFRELAEAYRERAIAVVLSGAGADGSLGLGRLREEGGVSVAQEPSEAEYAAMPRAAIETGFVDFVLPVSALPDKLVSLKENADRIRLPPVSRPPRSIAEDSLRELLALLRARTRHDFSNYKRSTLLRRVERRLQVTESEDVPAYLGYIRQHPEELQGMLRDLLISVTNFFRDPEAFRRLETLIVPRLFEGKGEGDQIRVWVAGCATGEEAYSVAMLLAEHAGLLANPPAVQVFATDIDDNALAYGRAGLYPAAIAADVSPERLKRFFVREGQHYRVRRELRETVLFAPHNLLRDPPFSKLNLVSCRNLLIYINRQTQDRILDIFHFSLKPGGFLFLGTSESADGTDGLFAPVEKKQRIFRRRDSDARLKAPPALPERGNWRAHPASLPQAPLIVEADVPFNFGEVHYRMLEALAPPSVLVNSDYDILHLSAHAGRYLRFGGGDPSRSLLKVVHPDLRPELRPLMLAAAREGGSTRSVLVNLDGEPRAVRVAIRPLGPAKTPDYLLVTFEEHGAASADGAEARTGESAAAAASHALEPVVLQLEEELERTRDRLRAMAEEYETSLEESKAANEELQAMNEELRSASEEMETGKEELQSVNEELSTLNHELREKIEELGRVNSDLRNLMGSTRLATVFLDRSLRVKLFTPSAQGLFNLIPADVGRPLAHVTHSLDYAEMVADAERVLRDFSPIEREAAAADGHHFLARLMPYRTTDDKIGGVVLTFTDITDRKQAEEARAFLAAIVESADDAMFTVNFNGVITSWNGAAQTLYGYAAAQAVGQPLAMLTLPEDLRGAMAKTEQIRRGAAVNTYETVSVHQGGRRLELEISLSPVRDAAGRVIGVSTIARDISARKQSERDLRASEERLRLVLESTTDYAIMLMDGSGRFTSWNRGAENVFGYTEAEALGQPTEIIFTPEDRADGVPAQELEIADREGRATDERWHVRKDGARVFVSGVLTPLGDGGQRGYAKIARDLTRQERAQGELRRAWADLDARVQERTAELAAANSAMRVEVGVRRRAEQDRLELLRRIVTTQEDERRRIARELHDQLGQLLTALRLKLETLDAEAGRRSKLRGRIAELSEIAARIDSDVDFLAWELRPAVLDDLGLIVALSNYTLEWERHFGVRVNFHSAGLGDARLSPLVETNLYRIAQEALNNVSKYAAATNVDLLLERRDRHVALIVEDNGRGFDAEAVRSSGELHGMGIVGMRERAALVGGTVEIESKPGDGTTVFVRVPVNPDLSDAPAATDSPT